MSAGEVLWVDELDDGDLSLVGSKMSRLGQLRMWGLTVPRGFAVTAEAYVRFMVEAELDDLVEEQLATIDDPEDTARIEAASAVIRAAIEVALLPVDLRDELVDAYDELSYRCSAIDIPVAVRSSAIGEDGSDASFAGQFDTYLGLSGAERVIDGIRRCWASLFTDRGTVYRLRNELSHRESPMAVCVLELIDARASGVAFSIDPVTGKRDRIVIEGNWGWGETVVQGLVTPDRVAVDKEDGRILSYDVQEKTVVSAFDHERGQVVERPMPERMIRARVLDEDQVGCIARAVRAIEEGYGQPMDVEWVIPRTFREGDAATIVQTRPETVHGDDAEEIEWDPVAMASKFAFGGDR